MRLVIAASLTLTFSSTFAGEPIDACAAAGGLWVLDQFGEITVMPGNVNEENWRSAITLEGATHIDSWSSNSIVVLQGDILHVYGVEADNSPPPWLWSSHVLPSEMPGVVDIYAVQTSTTGVIYVEDTNGDFWSLTGIPNSERWDGPVGGPGGPVSSERPSWSVLKDLFRVERTDPE